MSNGGPGAVNPYGHIDSATGEYVITRPDTPSPWLNYLGRGGYGGIVSNTGGGFSFDRDPRSRRVSRYRYNGIPADQPGRYVYLRDMETGRFWSPTWQPVRRDLEAYECRHAPGYTRICGTVEGIAAELLYFVPPAAADDPCPVELWVLKVRNAGRGRRRLRTFSYVEFGYLDAVADQQNLDWAQQIVRGRFEDGAILVATPFSPATSFIGSSRPALGYTADREEFVGRGHDLADPVVVVRGEPTDADSPRGNSVGSLCHEIELAAGEEQELVFVMGLTDRPAGIAAAIRRWSDPRAVDVAFAALRRDWAAYLSRFVVETPDPDTNAMLNVWNQVQCRTTLHWSRFVSGYETGLGRGMGTRDSAQDILGVLHGVPERASRLLARLWALQFRDGHAWHQFFPIGVAGGPGLAAEHPDWPQWFSDDHLWLVVATCAELRETGDFEALQRLVAWADGGEATVWDHLLRAIDFSLDQRGPHGLPRAGFADWDDTLNVDHGSGKAESVFAAMLFCRAALDLAELCDAAGTPVEAARFRGLHAEMAAAIDQSAWDGAWYARAFDDAGLPVGVAADERHQINLVPQVWAVIGEIASGDRPARALAAAEERLGTPFGHALLRPPYDGADARVGGTSTYPPGAKENGGIFCHAAAWAIVAAAMLGRGDAAYAHYRALLPLARVDADRLRAEPYVYCQNVCGPAHPQYGLGRNAWLTGTAAWVFVAASQWILGIRPTYRGLRIAPTIPAAWPGFRARRVFRGVVHEIEVRRAGSGNRASLTVDGRPIDGDVVPLAAPGVDRVIVEVVLD